MADENAELMELLDRLKAMRPGAGEEANAAARPVQQAKPQAPPQKAAKAAAAQPKAAQKAEPAKGKPAEDANAEEAAKLGVLTGEIYQKVFELEQDILSKENGIGADLRKLNELIEALGHREAEITSRESELSKKNRALNRDLEDMKRIRAELEKILK